MRAKLYTARLVLEIVLLATMITLVTILCVFAIRGARKVKALGDEASSSLSNLNRTIVIAAGAFSNLEKGGRAWKENSDAQVKITSAALGNLNAAAKSLDSLISSTNISLNSSLLPALASAIEDQNTALLKNQAAVGAALTEATATLADAGKLVSDPALKASIDNLSDASKSTAVATSEAAASMTKVREGINYEVNELEKPVKKVKVVYDFVLQSLGKFFGY